MKGWVSVCERSAIGGTNRGGKGDELERVDARNRNDVIISRLGLVAVRRIHWVWRRRSVNRDQICYRTGREEDAF